MGIAILLTLLFGPIGLFYASVTGGLIMIFTPVIVIVIMIVGFIKESNELLGWSFVLMVIFAGTYWLICIIWAVIGVMDYNKEIDHEMKRQEDLWSKLNSGGSDAKSVKPFAQGVVSDVGFLPNSKGGTSHIQDWLASNPGKSINDYYSKLRN